MPVAWVDLEIPDAAFDIAALHAALDRRRGERGLTWQAVAAEVGHAVSASTLRGLKDKRFGIEGDGVLQVLLWLGRTPESFVPGHPGAEHPGARLPRVAAGKTLRFDVAALYSKLEAQRSARALSWTKVANEIGAPYTAEILRKMKTQRRTGFPQVMRLARWLRCPVSAFTQETEQ